MGYFCRGNRIPWLKMYNIMLVEENKKQLITQEVSQALKNNEL